MKITAHIITKNNQETIEDCVNSLEHFDEIIIADLGSTDETKQICKLPNIKFIDLGSENNYSHIRNNIIKLSSFEWQFYLDPWEKITSGIENIHWAIDQNNHSYNVYNISGDIVTKQTRLWLKNKMEFINPVYEILSPESPSPLLDCFISGNPPKRNFIPLLEEWRIKQPTAPDIDYYTSYEYLTNGNYDKFLTLAEQFLFRINKISVAALITQYYCATIYLKVKHNPTECIRRIIPCLAEMPTMAELWCLAGDAFFKMKQFHRAAGIYDNAVLFGSRRKRDDPYPIEVSKYKEYPENMLSICKKIISNYNNISNSLTTTVT